MSFTAGSQAEEGVKKNISTFLVFWHLCSVLFVSPEVLRLYQSELWWFQQSLVPVFLQVW